MHTMLLCLPVVSLLQRTVWHATSCECLFLLLACCFRQACGIFFKHHQMHRPVELMTQPPRSHQQLLAPCPVAASLLLASGYSDQEGAAGLSGGWEAAARGRKRTVPEESDYSEQSDDDPEERRRSLRPRRTRQHAEEYLLELRVAAMAGPAAATAGEQESPDAGALDSDGGELGQAGTAVISTETPCWRRHAACWASCYGPVHPAGCVTFPGLPCRSHDCRL